MVAVFHRKKNSFPQSLGVSSQVVFLSLSAVRVLVDGSFGFGEILKICEILTWHPIVVWCERTQMVAIFNGKKNSFPQCRGSFHRWPLGVQVQPETFFLASLEKSIKVCIFRRRHPTVPHVSGWEQWPFAGGKKPHSPSVKKKKKSDILNFKT